MKVQNLSQVFPASSFRSTILKNKGENGSCLIMCSPKQAVQAPVAAAAARVNSSGK